MPTPPRRLPQTDDLPRVLARLHELFAEQMGRPRLRRLALGPSSEPFAVVVVDQVIATKYLRRFASAPLANLAFIFLPPHDSRFHDRRAHATNRLLQWAERVQGAPVPEPSAHERLPL